MDEGIITLFFASAQQREDRRNAKRIRRENRIQIDTKDSSHYLFVFSSWSRTARVSFRCLSLNDQIAQEKGMGTHTWTVTTCFQDDLGNRLSLMFPPTFRQKLLSPFSKNTEIFLCPLAVVGPNEGSNKKICRSPNLPSDKKIDFASKNRP